MAIQPTPSDLTQASYQGTPYEDQHWEIVGEFKGEEAFSPSDFEVLGSDVRTVVDPMFADYGGLPAPADRRSHGPITVGGAVGSAQFGVKKVEEEVDHRIRLHQHEIDRMLAKAREEGKIEALAEAVSQQQENLERLQSQINTILNDIDMQFKERVHEVEKQALDLALEISKRLVEGAVEINPEYILPILTEAIQKVGTSAIRSVRVSPEDLEFINIIGIEKQLKDFDGTWTFQADTSIRSGCVVETSAGEIDFQLDKAWDRLRDKILTVSRGV